MLVKYTFVLLAFLAVYSPAISNNPPYDEEQLLQEIRKNLRLATENEKVCDKLYNMVKDLKDASPLLKGYIGAVTIARSKHVSLLDKLSTFNKGTAILDEAIKLNPSELELRFLRLTLQLNLPGFLGYRNHLGTDKEFVLAHASMTNAVLKEKIVDFVKTSGHFTEQEKIRVR